jgi:hypothetical protein
MTRHQLADERQQDELSSSIDGGFERFNVAFESVAGTPKARIRVRTLGARRFITKVIVTVVAGGLPGGATEFTVRLDRAVAETLYEQLGKALGKHQ